MKPSPHQDDKDIRRSQEPLHRCPRTSPRPGSHGPLSVIAEGLAFPRMSQEWGRAARAVSLLSGFSFVAHAPRSHRLLCALTACPPPSAAVRAPPSPAGTRVSTAGRYRRRWPVWTRASRSLRQRSRSGLAGPAGRCVLTF